MEDFLCRQNLTLKYVDFFLTPIWIWTEFQFNFQHKYFLYCSNRTLYSWFPASTVKLTRRKKFPPKLTPNLRLPLFSSKWCVLRHKLVFHVALSLFPVVSCCCGSYRALIEDSSISDTFLTQKIFHKLLSLALPVHL